MQKQLCWGLRLQIVPSLLCLEGLTLQASRAESLCWASSLESPPHCWLGWGQLLEGGSSALPTHLSFPF